MSEPLALLLSAALMTSTMLVVLATGRLLVLRRTIARRTEQVMGAPLTASGAAGELPRPAADRLEAVFAAYRVQLALGLIAAVLTLAGALLLQWWIGLLLGAAVIAVYAFVQHHQRQQRKELLEAQLIPALRMLAAATESGYSITMALERMIRDLHPPIADEFAQVIRMVDLGMSLEDALSNLALRIGGEHFEFFATMIAVQYRSGGSLSVLLLDLARSIQSQHEFKLSVQARTAQARFSGWVVAMIPLFVLGVILLATPHYVAPLFDTQEGHVLLGIAAALLIAGQLTIRQISKVDL
jgi:tight adherence protein B